MPIASSASQRPAARSLSTRLRDWLLPTLWRLLLRLVPAGERPRLRELPRLLRTRAAQRAAGWDVDALALDLDAMALEGQLTLRLPGTTRIRADRAGLLLRHSIVRLNHTTSHALQFQGGGFFSFMVDDQQTMMEVHASNLSLSTATAGLLEVLPMQAPAPHSALQVPPAPPGASP